MCRRYKEESAQNLVAMRLTVFSHRCYLPPKPITSTAPHHQFANNCQQLPADYGSLPGNSRHAHGFHYKGFLPLPVIYRQGWFIYRRLPPVMKNYGHAGNAVMKSCTSSGNLQGGMISPITCATARVDLRPAVVFGRKRPAGGSGQILPPARLTN